jgi:predicted NBD/HSP70 family sugar kinase
VRINRDYLRVAAYDICGETHCLRETKVDSSLGATVCMHLVGEMIGDVCTVIRIPVMGIGVAVPGPFNYTTQHITLMSGFPGWDQIEICGELREKFGIPVFMDHDAKCGALAEMWHGKYRMSNHLLYICCDRGVGAGFILDGQIYRGRTGFAGEIGHASINMFGPICECGNHGCLELYCSANALEEEYRRETFSLVGTPRANPSQSTAKHILRRVQDGDPSAERAYTRIVANLAFGTVNVVNSLNPEVLIFGDKMIKGGDLFLQTARKVLKNYLLPEVYDNLIVDLSTLDGDPMLLGASLLVFEELLNLPSQYFGGDQNAADE